MNRGESSGPRRIALVDEARCIGCTLCIEACPFDAIAGARLQMHTVIGEFCTGCELCLPACPVDCIAMRAATGEDALWDAQRRAAARRRATARARRLAREREQTAARAAAAGGEARQALIRAAIERARARRLAANPPARKRPS